MPRKRKTTQTLLRKNETLQNEPVCLAVVPFTKNRSVQTRSKPKEPAAATDSSSEPTVQPARSKSTRTNESQRQTQTRKRAKTMALAYAPVSDQNAGSKPEKSAQSKKPSGALAVFERLVQETQTYIASQPSTGLSDSYSALHSEALPLTPTSLEEFKFTRSEIAKANNRKVYSNVAKDLKKYVLLLDYHIKKFKDTIDKLVRVSLVKENMVKDNRVINLLEKKAALKKAKTYLNQHIILFEKAGSSVDEASVECPELPDAEPDSAASNELARLVFEKQMRKKKIAEIQSGLLALRDVYHVEFIEEKTLADFNFKKYETELIETQSKLYALFKSMCKPDVVDEF